VGVILFVFFMFSSFYGLNLHQLEETCVAYTLNSPINVDHNSSLERAPFLIMKVDVEYVTFNPHLISSLKSVWATLIFVLKELDVDEHFILFSLNDVR